MDRSRSGWRQASTVGPKRDDRMVDASRRRVGLRPDGSGTAPRPEASLLRFPRRADAAHRPCSVGSLSLVSTHLRFTYLTTRPEAVACRSVPEEGRTGLQAAEASDAHSPLAGAKDVEKSLWVYTYRNSFVHVLDEDTASLDWDCLLAVSESSVQWAASRHLAPAPVRYVCWPSPTCCEGRRFGLSAIFVPLDPSCRLAQRHSVPIRS